MSDTLQTILVTLAVVVPIEYTFIALSSLVSKVVVTNFVRDLGEVSRSRETKRECLDMEEKLKSRYSQSLLWPLELWREFRKGK
jgi:hypothetical protein